MAKIYEQFDAAFNNVSAYAIFKGTESVGRVCIKYPKDAAGRLYAYVQVWGAPMSRGYAGGYGYDKGTAAVASAAAGLLKACDAAHCEGRADEVSRDRAATDNVLAIMKIQDSGRAWADQLRAFGYTVQHIIG